MKRYFVLFLAVFLIFQTGISQNLTKVIVSKFESGKPELVNYYKGAAQPINLVKQEKFGGDGKKTEERNYLDGKLHGAAMVWKDFDGTLLASLIYSGGVLDGKQVYYFSDGSPKIELNYVNGRLDGRQVEYFFKASKDSLKSEHNYSGGILHGMQRQWDKSGSMIYNLNFVAGKPDGIQRMYSESGEMIEEKWRQGTFEEVLKSWTASQARYTKVFDFALGGDSLNIEIKKVPQKEVWYFETGGIEALTTMNDPIETQVFYLGGKVKGRGAGTLEKKEGKWEFWYQSGHRLMSGEYQGGKQIGLFETWDENGKLISEEFWNPNGSGRETWKISNYHPNGTKENEGQLDAEGHKKGMWKYWYSNGNKRAEEDWQFKCSEGQGRPFIASLSQWDDSGRLVVKGNESDQQQWTYFPNGNPMELKTVVFPNRNPCSKGPVAIWKDGKFENTHPAPANYDENVVIEVVNFFEGGDTMNVSHFDMDAKRQGYQKGWFSDGKMQYEYHYDKGMPQGTVREWYPSAQIMLDLKVSSEGGTPSVVSGIYYSEKAKDYEFEQGDKKKKAIEEIEAASYFVRFWQENK